MRSCYKKEKRKKEKTFNGKSLLSVLHCIEHDKHVSISNHVEVLKHLVQAKSNVPAFTFSPNLFRVHLGHDSDHCQKYEPFVLIISKIRCKVKYACSG